MSKFAMGSNLFLCYPQIHKLLKGLPPIRSLVAVGSSAAKLVSLPVKSYKKDQKLLKGMQRGNNNEFYLLHPWRVHVVEEIKAPPVCLVNLELIRFFLIVECLFLGT